MRRLFDGRHSDPQILAAMPARVSDLLTPVGLHGLKHPDGELLASLRANAATCRWTPRTPVRLYSAHGDRAVTSANAEHCARDLRARGANADVIELGPLDHFPSMLAATPQVLTWFTHLTRTP